MKFELGKKKFLCQKKLFSVIYIITSKSGYNVEKRFQVTATLFGRGGGGGERFSELLYYYYDHQGGGHNINLNDFLKDHRFLKNTRKMSFESLYIHF